MGTAPSLPGHARPPQSLHYEHFGLDGIMVEVRIHIFVWRDPQKSSTEALILHRGVFLVVNLKIQGSFLCLFHGLFCDSCPGKCRA